MKISIAVTGFSFFAWMSLFAPVLASSPSPLVGAEQRFEEQRLTPFSWQNEKHYLDLKQELQRVSEETLNLALTILSKSIRAEKVFFKARYDDLLFSLRRTIHEWMINDVLIWSNFNLENYNFLAEREESSSESDEEEWRKAYQRGYERTESENEEEDFSDEHDENGEEDFQDSFEIWQLQNLEDRLGIDLENIEDFTLERIDIQAIRLFLKKNVEGSSEKNYSWLLNQIIEGDLASSEDFVDFFQENSKALGLSSALLHDILGGLWFDYDWEEFDIGDPDFLSKTYVRTLQRFKDGSSAKDIKTSL